MIIYVKEAKMKIVLTLILKLIAGALIGVVVIVALTFVVPGMYFLRIPTKHDVKIETIRHMIREELPLGSSRARVSEWLIKKKIDHGFVDGKTYDLNDDSGAVRSGIPVDKLSGIMTAKIPNSSRGILAEWNLIMIFFFNKQDKLLKYEIYEQSYGF